MSLNEALLSVLLIQAPPGISAFSVEPVPECAPASACPGARWSSHYGTWVRTETVAAARVRYGEIADAAVDAAEQIHAESPKGWPVIGLVSLSIGTALLEGGLREDVQTGRGRSGKPDDAGGQGRGPGNEACLEQIHPLNFGRVTDPPHTAKSLLGRDHASLVRCFKAGMRLLNRTWSYCGKWVKAGYARDYTAVSLFVTGSSCVSDPHGKTRGRVRASRAVWSMLKQRISK